MFFCCCGCTVFSDDFNRANSSSIGSSWTEHAGDWEIVSNKLTITGAADLDQATVSPTIPFGYQHSVEAKVQSSALLDEVGLVFLRDSSTLFVYVLLTIDGADSTIEIIKYDSGKTQLGATATVTAAVDTEYTLRVCANESTLCVYFEGNLVLTYVGGLTAATPVGGAITGNVTGTPQWDDFVVAKATEDIDPCPCDVCRAGDFTDDFTNVDALWAESPGPFTTVGGRLQNTSQTGQPIYERCAMTPELDGLDISFESEIYWDSVNVATVAIALVDPFGIFEIALYARPAVANNDYAYLINGGGGGGVIATAPVSGDLIKFRITDTSGGAGTYTVRFYVNGVLEATETSVSVGSAFGNTFSMALSKTSAADAPQTVEWDNFFYDAVA